VRTKYEVDGVFPEAILSNGDLSAHFAKLVTRITCLVQEALGVDIPGWLDDTQVDSKVHFGLVSNFGHVFKINHMSTVRQNFYSLVSSERVFLEFFQLFAIMQFK
jgi:hypothetical protein